MRIDEYLMARQNYSVLQGKDGVPWIVYNELIVRQVDAGRGTRAMPRGDDSLADYTAEVIARIDHELALEELARLTPEERAEVAAWAAAVRLKRATRSRPRFSQGGYSPRP